jgi:hypothetical protein
MILRVPLVLYMNRRERLAKLIALDAPPVVIRNECRLMLRSFKRRSLYEWFMSCCLPDWVLWLLSPDFRRMCRELDAEDEV